MSRQVSEWWNKLRPETQRRHIKRHPNGKYARWVKAGELTLKKLRNQSDEDFDKEREQLVEKARGPVPDINGGQDAPDTESDTAGPETDEEDAPEPSPASQGQIQDAAGSYQRSLPSRFKSACSAFVRSWNGAPLGSQASTQDLDAASATGDPRRVADAFNPRDEHARTTLRRTVKALMPLAKIAALGTLGVAGAALTGNTLPLMLVSYFINNTLDAASHSGEQDGAVNEAQDLDTLVNSFMQYCNQLQEQRTQQASTSSVSVRLKPCPVAKYKIAAGQQTYRYVLVVGDEIRGIVQHDKAMGDPDPSANSWYTVLFHGFNENAFPSVKPMNTVNPYTKVTDKGLRLVNPARMPLEFCLRWARQNIRR